MTIFPGSGNDPDNPKPTTRMNAAMTMTSGAAHAGTPRRTPGHGVTMVGKSAAAVPQFALPESGEFRTRAGRVLGRRNKAALALAAELGLSGQGKRLLKRVGQRQAAEMRLILAGERRLA